MVLDASQMRRARHYIGSAVESATMVPKLNRLQIFCQSHWRPLVLLALSCVLAGIYLVGRPYIFYNDGDPLAYFRKAWWLLDRPGGLDVPSRGPGYPLWLIFTGAATFDVWWGLMASQVAMAIAAPVLAYGIVAPMSRNAGFAVGLSFMVFAISYKHVNWIMTEELFMFVELLSFLLISRYLCGAWTPLLMPGPDSGRRALLKYNLQRHLRSPCLIALTLSFATMVKSQASPFYWLVLVTCLLFRVAPWKTYVKPTLLYVAIMTSWGAHTYFYSPVRFPTLGMPTTQAQREFADVYYGNGFGAVEVQTPTIAPKDGPASWRLYRAVGELATAQRNSGHWNVTDPVSIQRLYGRFQENNGLLDAIFTHPNPLYFQMVVSAAASAGGDRLLYQVAREHHRAGVKGFLRHLVQHPTIFLKGPSNPYPGYMFFMKFYRFRENQVAKLYGARNLFIGSVEDDMINDQYSPNIRLFKESIRYFVSTLPQFMGIGKGYLHDFGSDDALIKHILDPFPPGKYSAQMTGTIYTWLTMLYGEQKAGQLLGMSGIAVALHHPLAPGFLLGDLVDAMVLSEENFSGWNIAGYKERFDIRRVVEMGRPPNSLPKRMQAGVGVFGASSDVTKTINGIMGVQYTAYRWIKPVLFFLMLLFCLPLIIAGIGSRLVFFLAASFVASACAWSLVLSSPGGDVRQEDVYTFMPLMISILGIASIFKFCRLAQSGTLHDERRENANLQDKIGNA